MAPAYDEQPFAGNEVPCAAAIYVNDMYIPRVFSEETGAWTKGMRILERSPISPSHGAGLPFGDAS